MIIAKSKLTKWKSLKEQGDIEAIVTESGFHRHTISKAFSTGRGSEEVIEAIDKFYEERKKQIAA